MMARHLCVFVLIALTACEGSEAWYMTHPERQDVKINGVNISVVPRGNDHWDSFVSYWEPTSTSMLEQKKDQIAAIEQVSGCKVVESEYWHNAAVFQTKVKCAKAGGSK